MIEKLCVFCKHFFIDLGSDYYSDLTPGDAGEVSCLKKHQPDLGSLATNEDFRAWILHADKCEDYKIDA